MAEIQQPQIKKVETDGLPAAGEFVLVHCPSSLGEVYHPDTSMALLDGVIISLVICSVVGVGFGTNPASKVANLGPMESLNQE